MSVCKHCSCDNPADAQFCIECSKPLMVRDNVGGLDTPEIGRSNGLLSDLGEDLPAGTLVARRYTIDGLISGHRWSKVYRATEVLGGKTHSLALKIFRNAPPAREGAIDTFLERAMANQAIRNRNLVAVRNVGRVDDNCAFVAMELVKGITLSGFMREQLQQQVDPPLDIVLTIMRNMLDGMVAAHQAGLVHGILDTSAVFLTGEITAEHVPLTMLSFGLSSPDLFEAPNGVPHFMAREWITEGMTGAATADIYSISIIFYYLLMGVVPMAHWQPPSGARDDVPQAIDALILQGLSRNPASRPQSAAEYRSLLDEATASVTAKRSHQESEQTKSAKTPGGPKPAEPQISDRETVARGTMIIAPKKDAQGNWYMPEMVDKNGKRTKWSWWAGYMGAHFK